MTSLEKAIKLKHGEESRCIQRLQDLVHEKISQAYPQLIMTKLTTVDQAIIFYIDQLEAEIWNLKNQLP